MKERRYFIKIVNIISEFKKKIYKINNLIIKTLGSYEKKKWILFQKRLHGNRKRPNFVSRKMNNASVIVEKSLLSSAGRATDL